MDYLYLLYIVAVLAVLISLIAVRLLVSLSLSLVIVTSILLGNYLTKKDYKIMGGRDAGTLVQHN